MRWMNSPIHPLHHKECVCVCTVCVLVSSLLGSDSGQWPQWRSEDREVWSLLAQFTSQSNDGNDLFFVWFCWLFVIFVFRTIWILSFIWCCLTPVTLLKAKSLTIVAWTLWFVLFSQAVGCVGNVRSHYYNMFFLRSISETCGSADAHEKEMSGFTLRVQYYCPSTDWIGYIRHKY